MSERRIFRIFERENQKQKISKSAFERKIYIRM